MNKDENEKRSKLFNFYENIKQGSQILSEEELEIAIEALKLAQKTIKRNNHAKVQTSTKSNRLECSSKKCDLPILQTDAIDKLEVNRNKILSLPSYNWFVTKHDGKAASNVFTGSCRKDVTKGYFSTTTFNYKVSVTNVGKQDSKIVVECFLEYPWQKGAVREALSLAEYECSDHGLNEATAWLNNEWQKFIASDEND